ncbi:MAG: hypothetical protein ACODAJ_07280 [Planctomycetota bacterium]
MPRAALALCLAALALPAFAGQPQAAGLRVGTFRRAQVLVAYYRSATWQQILDAKRAERDQAEADGDADKVRRLEAWGDLAQERAHRQLAGLATLDANGLRDRLHQILPAVAQKAGVHVIVEQPLFHDDDAVTLIDVTAHIVNHLPPPTNEEQ